MTSTPLDPQWFIDEDFRFRLGTVPGSAEDFFTLSPEAAAVLAERREWLTTDPERYAAILPAGEPIAEELLNVTATWQMLNGAPPAMRNSDVSLPDRFRLLSQCLEPDLVLLAPSGQDVLRRTGLLARPNLTGNQAISRDPDGPGDPSYKSAPPARPDEQFTVVGGAVCFPSSWRLTDKLGQTVAEVHEPVPAMNAELGLPIDRLLARMRPGKCVVRANWGVCAKPELNQHPDRNLPGLQSPLAIDNAWLRREDQCLFTLPETRGVIFGIRVTHFRWSELRRVPQVARSVARTLRTMPWEMLEYKRLTEVRDQLANLLDD